MNSPSDHERSGLWYHNSGPPIPEPLTITNTTFPIAVTAFKPCQKRTASSKVSRTPQGRYNDYRPMFKDYAKPLVYCRRRTALTQDDVASARLPSAVNMRCIIKLFWWRCPGHGILAILLVLSGSLQRKITLDVVFDPIEKV